MKKLYFLFVLLPIVCFSQTILNQRKVDSILVLLNTKSEDTAKINLYEVLCDFYCVHHTTKTSYYNNKILQLSKKLHYEKGINFYNFNLIYFVGYDNEVVIMKKVEKASKYFFKVGDYKHYVISQCFLANEYAALLQPQKAKKIIAKTLPIAYQNSYNSDIGFLLGSLGRIYYDESLLSKALVYYNKAFVYLSKDKIINKMYSSVLHYHMALTHKELGNYKEALYYFNISQLEDKRESVNLNMEKANVYNKLFEYNKALKILLCNKNLQMYDYDMYNNTIMLSETYYGLKKYNNAITNLLPIVDKLNHNYTKLNSYNILAKLYLKIDNLQKAKEFNDKAGVLVKTTRREELKLNYLMCKTVIEEASGNYKAALQSQKQYTALKEQVNTKLNKEKINELQIGFKVAEKDNNIKNLKVAELEKNIQINTQTNYIIYGGIFLGILVLGILIFILLYRTIKKKNRLVSISNSKLENAKVQLEKSVQVKETLLKEIHHRVKNNLQLVMSLLRIQSKVKNINIADFIEISQSRILAMALIHENLYQTDNLSKVNFQEYVTKLTQSISASYSSLQKDIQLKIAVEEDIHFDIQTAIPLGLIINELVNNSYKHAFTSTAGGVISLQLKKKYNFFKLVIKDNGSGKLENVSSTKTLGLELVNQLVSQINGVIEVKNNGGTQYQIQFRNLTV